ncbi:hypothetical protein CPB86DRAFT_786814, partial [Serendipita vermifera]
MPLPSTVFSAEADAPLNLGLDEEEVVWGGESVGLGYGLLSRLKEKTNALLEAIDWDCRLCGKTATDPCVTRCGHLFCWSHLTKHLASSPRCPTCSTPLSMDRDVVQVFGRPKVIPNDAPWTNAHDTPGSRGSAPGSKTDGFLSPRYEEVASNGLIPPPSASPIDPRLRSPSVTSTPPNPYTSLQASRKNSFDYHHPTTRRHPLQRMSSGLSMNSDSTDPMEDVKPPVNVVVTTTSSGDRTHSNSPGDLNAKEEKEEDPWSTWKKRRPDPISTSTSFAKQTPSPFMLDRRGSSDSLRPPSPQLKTKLFNPGWSNRRAQASTDSFETHLRQSIDVKFMRGLSVDELPSTNKGEEHDQDHDENESGVIYLHDSPTKTTASLPPPLHSPTPKYAYPTRSTLDMIMEPEDYRQAGRKWQSDLKSPTKWSSLSRQPSTYSDEDEKKKGDVKSPIDLKDHFMNLKTAVENADEVKKGSTVDPLGRALCVFAVVLLCKIL